MYIRVPGAYKTEELNNRSFEFYLADHWVEGRGQVGEAGSRSKCRESFVGTVGGFCRCCSHLIAGGSLPLL